MKMRNKEMEEKEKRNLVGGDIDGGKGGCEKRTKI